jgi:hypothetical protein
MSQALKGFSLLLKRLILKGTVAVAELAMQLSNRGGYLLSAGKRPL